MQLGETIATYDVALALRGESGKFEVTGPNGEIFQVNCKFDRSISSPEWLGNNAGPQPFLIRKIAEPVSSARRNVLNSAMVDTSTTLPALQAPFLIENQNDDARAVSLEEVSTANSRQEPSSSEIPILELIYMEADPKQPSAHICFPFVALDHSIRREKVTVSCTSFNQFDTEIRRLQARLEEIRSRAKKQFYRAQAIATGA